MTITLGTTVYSLTNEFHARKVTLADEIRLVAEHGLGPGLEVVGFQSFRSFPDISDAEADAFAEMIDGTGLQLTCLGINADRFMKPDQPVDDDALLSYHERQLRSAAKLGFPLVRYQQTATPQVIRRLVPLAEELGVTLGLEIHAPHSPGHPDIMAYREMYDQVGSDRLGFIPDFGATAFTVPDMHWDYFRDEVGVPVEALERAKAIWHDPEIEPFERFGTFMGWCAQNGIEDRLAVEVLVIFGIINRVDPAVWAEIMDQCVHIHGKFYDIDAQGREVAIDYPANLKPFIEGGFDGTISCEWEGHMVSDDEGLPKVKAWHEMVRGILGEAV